MSVPADPKVFEKLREAGVKRVARWFPSAGAGNRITTEPKKEKQPLPAARLCPAAMRIPAGTRSGERWSCDIGLPPRAPAAEPDASRGLGATQR